MRTIETSYGHPDLKTSSIEVTVRKRNSRSFIAVKFVAKGTYFRTRNMELEKAKEGANELCKTIANADFPWLDLNGDRQWFTFDPNALTFG